MDPVEKCLFCGRTSPEADLVAWFVGNERRITHGECWIDAHRSNRLPAALPADSGGTPRKSLDEIRRELEAEYEGVSEAPEPPVLVARDDAAAAVEPDPPVARRREGRRRYPVAAALGAGAVVLLLVVAHVAVTREPVRPNALVANPEPREAEPPTPAVLIELEGQLKALRSDLERLGHSQERSDSRIADMESRVRGVESSVRRLADDVATAAASHRAERSVTAPRHAATKPTPVAPLVTASAPPMASESERWIPAEQPVRASSPAPREVRPVAEPVTAPEARTRPVATNEPAVPPAPRAVAEVRPSFRDKLRADWRTIKQGVASAGDDFKAAMRDFGRKVAGE